MRNASTLLFALLASCSSARVIDSLKIDCRTTTSPSLQARFEAVEADVRYRYTIDDEVRSAGVVDLETGEIAMIRPDRLDYAASVPKIGILLAWMTRHPGSATPVDVTTRHELGMMIKSSSNEMATKYSRAIGMSEVQRILDAGGFYDRKCGGGLWFGKHYGPGSERVGDPIGDHSHAATVRQLLRYYVLLEQGKLVSPAESTTMREIFASPGIEHDDVAFVKGLEGRGLEILRKVGSWQTWHLDTALVRGHGRHYILVAMTRHASGEAYLADLATAVDNMLSSR